MTGAKFIYVGRLSGEKHIERILCSFAQTPPCATLQIIGDGPERDSLHRLAESLGLSGRVEWTGWVKDAWAEVQEASALVLTSSSEGLPLVLLEAAARGVPLIAMDCDYGPREIVNPENGWLLPLGDAAALAVLLQRIVNGEAALPPAEAVMETARPFGVEVVTDRIEDAIRRTVERRSRPMPQEQVGLDD